MTVQLERVVNKLVSVAPAALLKKTPRAEKSQTTIQSGEAQEKVKQS